MTQQFNIGEKVYRKIDVDAAEYNTDQPTEWYVVKIKAQSVQHNFWIYKYYIRGATANSVRNFNEAELCGEKETELTLKLLPDRTSNTSSTTALSMEQQLQIEDLKLKRLEHEHKIEMDLRRIDLESNSTIDMERMREKYITSPAPKTFPPSPDFYKK